MKRFSICGVILSLIVCSSLVALSQERSAEMPRIIQYSGTLKNVDGSPRTGTFGIAFAIYAEDKGTVPLWQEIQNVVVDERGHYSVLLGSARAEGLPDSLFAGNMARWLSIHVEGEREEPRVMLVAVPYALKAADAETLGGKPLSAFVLNEKNSGGNVTGGRQADAGAQTGVTTVQPMLNTGSTGTQNYLAMWTDSSGTLGNSNLVQLGSNVGVGTTTPNAPLQIGPDFTLSAAWPTMGYNLYYDGGWKFATAGSGSLLQQDYANNGLRLAVAPAGTAGGAATLSEAMFIASTGNVGMGTTTPVAPLQVGPDLTMYGNWPSMGFNLYYNSGFKYATTHSGSLIQQDYVNNGLTFSVAPAGTAGAAAVPTSTLFIGGTGKVGIGTTSPAEKLVVAGNISASGNVAATGNLSASGTISGNGSGVTNLSASALTGTIPNTAFSGTYSNAVTLSNVTNSYAGNGSALTSVSAANVGSVPVSIANLRLITYLGGCDSCGVLTTSDNQNLIYQNLLGAALTIQSITCYSDAGAPSINIQRDTGSATATVTASAIPCSTTGSTVSSFSVATVNANDKLNFLMTTPDSIAHRVTVLIKTTL